ncbi:MAG: FHA domain-containing protein [bacterium]
MRRVPRVRIVAPTRIDMPVIKVNDQQYTLRPGPNRLGSGVDADVHIGDDAALGVQAIVDLAGNQQAVIRRNGYDVAVRVNGVNLVDPTPLIHGDKVEIGGKEVIFSDDTKVGATSYVSASDIADLAQKRGGPARATAATGGRLVSLVDGKEYAVPATGISIGRDATCTVVIALNEVSRNHAELIPVEKGYEIRDLSANGVLVNGSRIQTAQLLSRADVIRIGTEEFRFYADLAATASVARAPEPKPIAAPSVSRPAPVPVQASPATVAAAAVAAAVVSTPADSRPVLGVLEVTNEGPTKGTQYELRVPLAHVGRGAHNDISINDDSVSDTHAKLQHRDDGWYVVDVGSTNGTYVGGQRVTGERRLDGPTDLRFGGVKTIFRIRDSAADTSKGTRAIAQFNRPKLTPTVAIAAALPLARTSALPREPSPNRKRGVPGWVWVVGVVVFAIVAVAAFFLLNR